MAHVRGDGRRRCGNSCPSRPRTLGTRVSTTLPDAPATRSRPSCSGGSAARSISPCAQGSFLRVNAVLNKAALGADDPKPRPVGTAYPTVLDLKKHAVKLHDDPPVPAGVDSGQGAGTIQAEMRRQGPNPSWRAWSTRCAHPVVEDRTGRVGPAAPAARRGKPADRAIHQERATQTILRQELSDGAVIPIPAPVVKDRKRASRAVAGGNHSVGFGSRKRHHLVDHTMAARVECCALPVRRGCRVVLRSRSARRLGRSRRRRGWRIRGRPCPKVQVPARGPRDRARRCREALNRSGASPAARETPVRPGRGRPQLSQSWQVIPWGCAAHRA